MRVLIADDHDLLRDTLVMFLAGQDNIEAQTAADLDAALDKVSAEAPFDLLLLDYNMPGMNGLAGMMRAMAHEGGQRVALMSGQATRDIAEQALDAGAAGFVPKTLPAQSMVNAIRFMAMGEQYAPIDFMTAPVEEPKNALTEKLSPREYQVLRGLTEGKSNKEIARDLGIQEPTVKLHVKTLYRKIDASNRTQAALIAREAGLFADSLSDRYG
ncbi:two component transcriptional regulator, LuxR family [Aliiroseovarius halocynthiae]|uniref:Response regulator transcription factor n=1 Tax=Aliiroseovarius halocynthiae TaxID=985055 RepID=A0A545SWN8_9RHOB|nr:response regulator transcription factor [Aliiroseovarius halocynthiae]TQV69378.1 response regulator transcription factor [Aliiroseovarius halocynthiae]SMR72736.1 two component transcriptional regulator, LuxR family [Aliiroseovarius halocynthiae]